MTLLFIDTERDQRHRIIQIGIAVFDEEGELKDTFRKLINTGIELTSHIERLTGIKSNVLSKEILPHEANEALEEFLEKHKKEKKEKLLTYAWGEDATYVNKFYDYLGIEDKPIHVENIQKRIAIKLTNTSKKTLSLKTACQILSIPFEETHDALNDAIATGRIYYESQKENRVKYTSLEMLKKTQNKNILKVSEEVTGRLKNCEGIARKNKREVYLEAEKTSDKNKLIKLLILLEKEYANKKEKKEKYPFMDLITVNYERLLEVLKRENEVYQNNKKEIEKIKKEVKEKYEEKEKELIEETKENVKKLIKLVRLKKYTEELDSLGITGFGEKQWEELKKEFESIEN